MSRKLSWSVDGFARRVMMGGAVVHAVIEGRRIDPVFYDRLLDALLPNITHEVTLVEQITLPSQKTAGGKTAVLGVYDHLRRSRKLSQTLNSGMRSIALFVDRDFDHYKNTRRRSAHVIYTQYHDVESEVWHFGDFARALASALSLTRPEAEKIAKSIGDPLEWLSARWSEWIELCCLAACMQSHCEVRASQASRIHDAGGRLQHAELRRLETKIRSTARKANAGAVEARVRRRFARDKRSADLPLLVPGKWISREIAVEIRNLIAGQPVDLSALESGLLPALIDTIDFGNGFHYWRAALAALPIS